MPKELNWRILFIIAVTLVCLVLIYPTARYFIRVTTHPQPRDALRLLETKFSEYFQAPPPETDRLWRDFEAKLDELLAVRDIPSQRDAIMDQLQVIPDKRKEFLGLLDDLAAQRQLQKLRDKSIKLGLDLQGGVDVLLSVDMEKAALDRLRTVRDRMKRTFQDNNIDATFEMKEKAKSLLITLEDQKDYRATAHILDEFRDFFEPFDVETLQSGHLELTLNPDVAKRYAQDAVDSALKVIRQRVDELGVTQPSVAKQGANRIRVQLPGERDPERVVRTIIRPATLEFRLLHDNNDELVRSLVDEKGNLLPDAQIPAGYILLKGEVTSHDPKTRATTVKEDVPFLVRDKAEITGKNLVNSWVNYNEASLESPVQVWLEFDRQGARDFRETTTNNLHKRLAVVLDNYVYSAPVIDEVIPNGVCFIRGNFTMEEARELSLVLKAGALPAELKPEEKRAVEATLGTDSIKSSVKALVSGAVIVVLFMILYYGSAGLIADFALVLNVLVILAVLAMARATLTLSGIGGVLLTIGMAVDANVLIYERIREEAGGGKPLKAAVSNGFRRAFTVILDSNMTTLIAALVLLQFAEGSVQGFALCMTVGLLANLYTGLTVTHSVTDLWVGLRNKISLGRLAIFRNTNVKFIAMRYGSYALSTGLILLCIGTLIVNKGPTYAVDFSGGVVSDVAFHKTTSTSEVRKALTQAGITGERVQKVAGQNEYSVRTKLMENNLDKTQATVETALRNYFGPQNFTVLGTQSIGNEIGQEFIQIALTALIIASVCILIYLGFRFQLVFGAAAVIALLHDAFITLGLITLLGREVSLDVVSALLIVIGYSVNDTIVIFDRIRENMRSVFGKSFREIADMSINQSLSRTFITAGTTLMVILAMYFLGGKGLNDFALTLLIGIAFGTYSSSFVATPLVYEYSQRKGLRIAKEKQERKIQYKTTQVAK
jgi:SecD/SecF fusion protein